jgi:hypothetical protein
MSQMGERGSIVGLLLALVLVMGLVAAVAIPMYLGSGTSTVAPSATGPGSGVVTAKSAEGKEVAGALWNALQTNAMAACGSVATVNSAFPKAGLTASGTTTPPRWTVSSDATLVFDCGGGGYTASRPTLFTVVGTAADVNVVRIHFQYDPRRTPPSSLSCSVDGGATFADC